MTKLFHRYRRQFLSTSIAAAVAPMIVPSHILGRAGAVAPSNKLTLGVIGIGPRCTYDLSAMLKFEDVQTVAIADVQASHHKDRPKKVEKAAAITAFNIAQCFSASVVTTGGKRRNHQVNLVFPLPIRRRQTITSLRRDFVIFSAIYKLLCHSL